MPTPPQNLAPIVERFAHLLNREDLKAQTVANIPKQSRVREMASVMRLRRKGLCEFPGCKRLATENHHTTSRGAGGGDESANTGKTCRQCHTGIHNDPRMRVAWDATMARRNGLLNWEVVAVVEGFNERVKVRVIVPAATDLYAKDLATEAIRGSQLGSGDNRTVTIETAEKTDKPLCAVEVVS